MWRHPVCKQCEARLHRIEQLKTELEELERLVHEHEEKTA